MPARSFILGMCILLTNFSFALVQDDNSFAKNNPHEYRVLISTYEGQIPAEDLDKLLNIGKVKPVTNADGSTSYYSRSFQTQKEAKQALTDYEVYGFEEMKVVKFELE